MAIDMKTQKTTLGFSISRAVFFALILGVMYFLLHFRLLDTLIAGSLVFMALSSIVSV